MGKNGSAVVELKSVCQGDTWLGLNSITIRINGAAVDLTSATVEMHMRLRPKHATLIKKWSSEDGSIEVTDPIGGIIKVMPVDMNVSAQKYYLSMQVTLNTGRKITIFHATLDITPNATHDV